MRINLSQQMKRIVAVSVTSSILACGLQGGSVVFAEKPIINSSTPMYGVGSGPAVKSMWSLPLAKFDQDGRSITAALAEEGRLFALVNGGQLAAYDGTSGRQLWKYGSGLRPVLAYDQGSLYGLTTDGAVIAVTKNGSKQWTTAIRADKADKIIPVGDTIYVTQNLTLFALERATGKLKWKIVEEDAVPTNDITVSKGVVLRSYLVQGALTSNQINAYDQATGKKLWTSFAQFSPLLVKDGLVYSVMDTFMRGDDDSINKSLQIAVLDLLTGKKKGERVYNWTVEPEIPGLIQSGGAYGSAFLDGNDLYIYQGNAVAKYNFSSYTPNGKAVQRWNAPNPKEFQPLYSIHGGKLLYQSFSDNSILALKTTSGQGIHFPSGIKPVQTDLFANGLFVARADGTLDAYNFATTKPVFSVKTGSREFDSTLKSGDMIYVRSGGTLLAVKLPAGLIKN
ncbi:PQQ-like domain-containing protein [Paenibacillus algorifonticola]|uniref:PQQ-like domain-containing protein n=1 Tax=Paenibacillus algorifonticola TaxID=684063 RepID=A0A1I1Z6N7_9BACL|nr:PQQ-binding-like beta-propeller repeat protein [Paenibacillus algorifonticola]SFE27369.1 PQQ-like domain-containing protein [Paenibacillus algorifonticola]